MDEIKRLFPTLAMDHVRTLSALVVKERNAVAEINKVYASASWGLACLACQAVKNAFERLDKAGLHPWFRYIQEPGMAYTVLAAGVPLRVQPDVDDIRDVMPGERLAIQLGTQMSLFPKDTNAYAILRIEVAQKPGKPVDSVTLCLFNERTGDQLDSEELYNAFAVAPPSVIPLARPAQDADTSKVFKFPEEKAKKPKKKGDGKTGKK